MFRDPVGTEQSDQDAHGDAFDRVSAFQDGYDQGVELCKDMSVENRTFTQRGFLSADDAERGGNLRVRHAADDHHRRPGGLLQRHGHRPGQAVDHADGDARPTRRRSAPRPTRARSRTARTTGEIDVATGDELPKLHTEIGDFATGTLLASPVQHGGARRSWGSRSTARRRSGRCCA